METSLDNVEMKKEEVSMESSDDKKQMIYAEAYLSNIWQLQNHRLTFNCKKQINSTSYQCTISKSKTHG